LLITAIGIGYYFSSAGKPAPDGKKSLAVLPFVNVGNDPNAEYLSDGISESIINNLSQLSGLRVMSRNSAFRFKNNQTDTKNIAAQLGVESLVTGDITQSGNKLIINVRLINAADDSQIWGNQYVKSSGDLIAAQNEIARAVAGNLRVKLTETEQQRMGKNYTANAEAYQLYMKGRFYLLKATKSDSETSISYFRQAIELDPNYALAYTGLSDVYRGQTVGGEMPSGELMPKAKAAAQTAVELDDQLAEAYANLGHVYFWYDWDWNAAEMQYQRALELDPNNPDALQFYAHLLSALGRHTEALAKIKRARELDPLNLRVNSIEGMLLYYAGQTDEAIARLQKTLELAPDYRLAQMMAARAFSEKGRFDEAISATNKAREISPDISEPIAYGTYALARSGKRAEAKAAFDELLKSSESRYVPPYSIALIYNALDEKEKALDYLEKGFAEKDVRMVWLKVEPKWNNLRNEPRFIDLIRRMNFESIAGSASTVK
jgi:TolB-like protein/Tfp pilus assembly protein PilF